MLSIRLQRIGRRNDPVFRVIVTEKTRGPKSGKHVELLGSYDPRQKRIQLKPDRIKYWISEGAEVSDTVHNLLIHEKVIEGKKINVLPRKSPIVKSDLSEEPSKEVGEKAPLKAEKTAGGEGVSSGENEESSGKVDDGAPTARTGVVSEEKREEKSKKEKTEEKPEEKSDGGKGEEVPTSEEAEIPTAAKGQSVEDEEQK